MQDAAAAAAQLLEGANLNPSWLAACAAHIASSGIPGFASLPAPQRAKLLLQQLLQSDLHTCGAPSLPQGVQVSGGGGENIQQQAHPSRVCKSPVAAPATQPSRHARPPPPPLQTPRAFTKQRCVASFCCK